MISMTRNVLCGCRGCAFLRDGPEQVPSEEAFRQGRDVKVSMLAMWLTRPSHSRSASQSQPLLSSPPQRIILSRQVSQVPVRGGQVLPGARSSSLWGRSSRRRSSEPGGRARRPSPSRRGRGRTGTAPGQTRRTRSPSSRSPTAAVW